MLVWYLSGTSVLLQKAVSPVRHMVRRYGHIRLHFINYSRCQMMFIPFSTNPSFLLRNPRDINCKSTFLCEHVTRTQNRSLLIPHKWEKKTFSQRVCQRHYQSIFSACFYLILCLIVIYLLLLCALSLENCQQGPKCITATAHNTTAKLYTISWADLGLNYVVGNTSKINTICCYVSSTCDRYD